MRQPRCPYCRRPVGRFWLRCRVCAARLAPWYALIALASLAALLLVALLLFYETVEHVAT
jgi:hypothetical protein